MPLPGRDILLVFSYVGLIGSVTLFRANFSLFYAGEAEVVKLSECDDVNVTLP